MAHDLATFRSWLSQAAPPSSIQAVVAYNFNIAETIDAFEVELVGSSWYDPDDSDWVCEEDWTSRPSRYVAHYAEAGRVWEPFLDWVVASVREYASGTLPGAETLRQARAVAVGFVDGNLTLVVGGGDA
jgi:hypothetical protein